MKLGVLFSGGKDSTYAAYLAKQQGNEIACLITIYSENQDSYMFHTPSIEKTKNQAEVMEIPLLIGKTKGIKEEELVDLENVILEAKEKYEDGFIVRTKKNFVCNISFKIWKKIFEQFNYNIPIRIVENGIKANWGNNKHALKNKQLKLFIFFIIPNNMYGLFDLL